MDDLVEQLMEEETVDGKEVEKLVEKFKGATEVVSVVPSSTSATVPA
jgi:hypothetical protein